MRLITAALSALLCSCAHHPEVTLLFGPKSVNGNQSVGATLMVIQKFGRVPCGYVHTSDPQHGKPFNDAQDDTLDYQVGCGWRWDGR